MDSDDSVSADNVVIEPDSPTHVDAQHDAAAADILALAASDELVHEDSRSGDESEDTGALLHDLNDFDYSMPGFASQPDTESNGGIQAGSFDPGKQSSAVGALLDWGDDLPELRSSNPGIEEYTEQDNMDNHTSNTGFDLEGAMIQEEESGGDTTLASMAQRGDGAEASDDSLTGDMARSLRQSGRKVSFAERNHIRLYEVRGENKDKINDFWQGTERQIHSLQLEEGDDLSIASDEDSETREGRSLLATGVDVVTSTIAKLPLNRFIGDLEPGDVDIDELHMVDDDVEAVFVRRKMTRLRRAWVTFRDERVVQIATCVGCTLVAAFIAAGVILVNYAEGD